MLFELFVATMAVNLKTCFETFCRDFGLEHQFSSPCVACQNGVVERKNRSLCEMARTMLDELRTPR
jgi:transposase InsO family protein